MTKIALVRKYIEKRGLSAAKIAHLANINRDTVSRILSGVTKKPQRGTLQKLKNVLKIPDAEWEAAGRPGGRVESAPPPGDQLSINLADLPKPARNAIIAMVSVLRNMTENDAAQICKRVLNHFSHLACATEEEKAGGFEFYDI